MNVFTLVFARTARPLIMAAFVWCCLLAMDAQAATPVVANPALASPPTLSNLPAPAAQSTAGQDIRDIRPPYHIPPGWLWIAWTAAGLALLGIGYGAWKWHGHVNARVKLPYEIALEQLEAARPLMRPERANAFSFAVSEVVRNYIETCFPVRAAHRTTEEFLRDLARRPDSPLLAHQGSLTHFLRHCDLAKFARWILSVPQMEAMLQSAGAFIVATGKPVSSGSKVRSTETTSPPADPTVGAAATSNNPILNPQSI